MKEIGIILLTLALAACCIGSKGWTDDGSDYDTRECPAYVSDCTD